MSTLWMVVTWAEVRLLITMCSAILVRMALIGSMRTLACCSAGRGGAAAGARGCSGGASGLFLRRDLLRLRGWFGGRGRRGGAVRDPRDHGVDPHRLTFLDQHLGQRPGGRRRNFGIDLIGRDLEEGLVALDMLALLLQPLR